MRWSIRNQILLPFVAIQITTLMAMVLVSAWNAVRETEEDINARLANVLDTLEDASFPLTSGVLSQLQALSGAHFVVVDPEHRITSSTIEGLSHDFSPVLQSEWMVLETKIIQRQSLLTIGNEKFFVGHVGLRKRTGVGSVLVLYPEKSWELARWQALYPPLGIGAVVLLLTVIASVWISNRIGGRIKNVQYQVSRIAEGILEPVNITRGDDELKDLSESVNRMCSALKDSMQTIRETERSELVSQLVGGLAHQFRNAITGARISFQLHQRRCKNNEDEAVDVGLRQLKLMEEQIKGLLRLTRGEPRTCSPASVDSILDETMSLVDPICRHKKIELIYEGGGINLIVSDSDAIRAAILNLVMNAIDAAGPDGQILVSSRHESTGIVIDVSDDGPGVPEEIEHEIFAPFFSTKKEGVGLGLALAQQAVRDCDGSLSLHRNGEMTTFRLTFSPESSDRTNDPEAVTGGSLHEQ